MDALAPYMSGETLCFICQKMMPDHLSVYTDGVKTLLKAQKGTVSPTNTIFRACLQEHLTFADMPFYRHATELYNHSFWLHHLSPPSQSRKPSQALTQKLLADFGSMDKVRADFLRHGLALDAKWVWLVEKSGKLTIITTDKDSPIFLGYKPIAACNLWQHAYYLDYRDRKADYINAYLDHLIDWNACEQTWADTQIWTW